MERGALIVLEGVDGAGKSTQIERLCARLRKAGHEVRATREPTDGPWGRRIRRMARSGETVAPEEELRWFVEDRAEHVARLIEPALQSGCCVVSDRYFLSTAAYQGARGLDAQALLRDGEARFPVPDLALVLEIEPDRGLARVTARGGPSEPAFERPSFLAEVAKRFRELDRPWIVRIDADAPPEDVERAIAAAVAERLGLLPVPGGSLTTEPGPGANA